MAYQHSFKRHKTREVRVGDKVVGGDNPIWVQSMTTTDTYDLEGTLAEIE
ncbi:MAG TPA: flavodoxin-dependent (E)-4-hydroxy-3-methylbut-2-enyl-diphosphate synthase, partial [Gemmataceae bacterium]|nr:flavodoxin-dependent (E)-4-hydroxy-3-methylbut-2-enyl-diphosphate synthase [Gemmataceae bacterium]